MPETLPATSKYAPARPPPRRQFTRKSKPRGPKDRPLLRLEQRAIWRVRMRIWCNTIKSGLLGSAHFPRAPQTYRVIQHPDCPISNASTWLTWWRGDAVPQPTHIESANRLLAGSGRILELQGIDTALQRSLYAIDLTARPCPSIKVAQSLRGEPAWRLLRAIRRTWCGSLPMARNNLRDGDRVNEQAPDIEPVLEYSPLEPFSAFRYLTRLATCTEAWEAARRKEWSLDLASASMAVRTLVEVADIPGPPVAVLGPGANYFMMGLISQIFWTPLKELDPNFVRLCAGKTYGTEYGAALTNLVSARRTLFTSFRALGIPRAATSNLTYVHQSLSTDDAFRVARAPF